MANGCNRLAGVHKVSDECNCGFVQPQLVRVDRAAWQQQGVVVLDRCISYQPVDRKGASGLKVVVTGLDLAIVQGQQIGLGSCLSQRTAWLLYLDPLHAVCGQNGHSFSS